MKKVTLFTATAVATALIASPVLAKDTSQHRGDKQMKVEKSEKRMKSSARMQTRPERAYHRALRNERMGSRDGWNDRNERGWNNTGWNDRSWDNRSTGFWPADVVGGAVGTAGAIASGAVNTAGAIATAPFGGPYREGYRDSYAFGGPDVGYSYNGVAMPQSANYAARNGYVCQPGTVTRAKNGSGVAVICQ